MSNYEKLDVWQKAHELTIKIYMLTKQLPKEELFGLTSQIRRAAISVESNLAEGESRYTTADKLRFFIDARGSAAEVETQLLIISDIYKNLSKNALDLKTDFTRLCKQINSLMNYRRRNSN